MLFNAKKRVKKDVEEKSQNKNLINQKGKCNHFYTKLSETNPKITINFISLCPW